MWNDGKQEVTHYLPVTFAVGQVPQQRRVKANKELQWTRGPEAIHPQRNQNKTVVKIKHGS